MITLHLVRRGQALTAEHDWVVDLEPLVLTERGTPPIQPGPIDHAQLVQLVFAADRVVTW